MSSRSALILALSITSGICFGIFFTNKLSLIAVLIGFLLGLLNVQWLFRDSKKVIEERIEQALKRYMLSLFSRLGIITMIVAIIGKYKPDWLFLLAAGIAGGVIIPLIMAIRQNITERG